MHCKLSALYYNNVIVDNHNKLAHNVVYFVNNNNAD